MKLLIVICMTLITDIILALDFNYTGCYRNTDHVLLTGQKFIRQRFMTAKKCVHLCRHGFQYAGTEFSYKCFCGNDTVGILTQKQYQLNKSKCDSPCSGKISEMCGGNYKISIYKIRHDKNEKSTTVHLPKAQLMGPLFQDTITKTYTHSTKGSTSLDNVSFNRVTVQAETTTENVIASKSITAVISEHETTILSTTSKTKQDGTNLSTSNPWCPCSSMSKWTTSFKTLSREQIEIMLANKIKEIKKELTLNKSTLSSFTRRKTCARDDRRSAAVLGWVGILIIVLVLSVFILFDILRFCQ